MSSFLSVSVSEKDARNSERAAKLGMDTKYVNGEYVYEFVIRKKFSGRKKRVIIETVGDLIRDAYPNDMVKYNKSIPAVFAAKDINIFWKLSNE